MKSSRLALAVKRCDGNAERFGVKRSVGSAHLGESVLEAPYAESARTNLSAQPPATPPARLSNLLDSSRDDGARSSVSGAPGFGSLSNALALTHEACVSETETVCNTFQEQKRNHAIPLASLMAKLLAPDMEVFEERSAQLGVPFDKVLKKAGVADPGEARASRSRMRTGGAPRVRRRLKEVLTEYERQRQQPTQIGAIILGLTDWHELGSELAEIQPHEFLRLLSALRARVESARTSKKAEKAFYDGK